MDQVIGRGGFATVYAARHVSLGSAHAIKVLPAGVDEDAQKRLIAEGRLQARLAHPNVVRVTDILELPDRLALVMDRVEGQSLRSLLDSGAPSLDVMLALAEGILSGASAAHTAGLIHRDLKPENVLVGPDGVPKITDFGLARAEDPTLRGAVTRAGVGMGTPGYMAPEAYTDVARVDARADVFALGALLYELVSGQRAFPGGRGWFPLYKAACNGAYARLDPGRGGLAVWQVEAIHAALDPNPEGRPSDATALLSRWRGLGGPSTRPTSGTALTLDLGAPTMRERPASAPLPPHRLPAERDAFVGREHEMTELDERLGEGARLVSVLGIGGTGKTRLMVHYGRARLNRWPGGVWFCDLVEARDADGVAYAVAAALDIPLGRDPIQQLGHAIAGHRRCLVILDNFEQVTRYAAETLGLWLDRAPQATFVVTTRERLGLKGEQVLALDPLSEEAAVSLFVARARAVNPNAVLHPQHTLRELVRLLDHLPLAVELAAARVRLMTPATILARMGERFKLLASPGAVTGRHSTLRAMLDWSWELLTSAERAGLAQLSVFAGGLDLEAAEAVLDTGDVWPIDVIQSLVDRSLLRQSSGDRVELLVSVSAYAAERLDQLGLRAETEARHGAFYAQRGSEEALAALFRHGGVERRVALVRDLDNLLVASQRAVTHGDAQVAIQSALAASFVVELRGPFALSAVTSETALAMPGWETPTRVQALCMAGRMRQLGGRLEPASQHVETALELARRIGDRRGESEALTVLAGLLREQGRMDQALAAVETALTLARAVGDRLIEGHALIQLGIANLHQGRPAEALAAYSAALDLFRALGHRINEGVVRGNLGAAYIDVGRIAEGLACQREALAIHREVGNRRFEAVAFGNLGVLCYRQGRPDEARAHLEAALALHREVGDRSHEGGTLNNLGLLHFERLQLTEARANFEAMVAIQREIGNRRNEGVGWLNLGNLNAEEGRLDEADACFETALALHREVGDLYYEGVTLTNQGLVRVLQGRLAEARATFEAAHARHRSVGNLQIEGQVHRYQALLSAREGRLEEALVEIERAMQLHRRVSSQRDEGITLHQKGKIYILQGESVQARAALASSEATLRAIPDLPELGHLLLTRVILERRLGAQPAVEAALAEASSLIETLGVGLNTELGRRMSSVLAGQDALL